MHCQPVLNDSKTTKIFRNDVDGSVMKTIRFNLFLVIHDFSVLIDTNLDEQDLRYCINGQQDIKELEQTPMVRRSLKEHLRHLEMTKNRRYKFFESEDQGSKSALEQKYEDLDEFLDSQDESEGMDDEMEVQKPDNNDNSENQNSQNIPAVKSSQPKSQPVDIKSIKSSQNKPLGSQQV